MNINRTREYFYFDKIFNALRVEHNGYNHKKKKKKNNPRSNAQKRSRAWPVFFARRKNRRFPGEYFIPARIYARVNEWQAKSPGVMKSCNLRGKCARVITSMLAWFVIVVENISLCKGCSCLLEKNNPRFERLVDHPSTIRISECKRKKGKKKISARSKTTRGAKGN